MAQSFFESAPAAGGRVPMNRFRQRPHFVWQLRTRRVPLGECTRLMAIVNVMPQVSFGDSPLIHHDSAANIKLAIATAVQAVDEGADIVDLGTESPKPGNPPRTTLEEQSRLIPVLEGLLHARPEARGSRSPTASTPPA
jgi:dihydropteroate synthase